MKENTSWALWIFNATYLFWGGAYFLQDLNFEFVIYIAVILIIIGTVLLTAYRTQFPVWQLWLLSLWGLMHVLGGAVTVHDTVLFGYRIYPFLDLGGEFYILKYDQVVHAYLYGLVGMMSLHILRRLAPAATKQWLLGLFAILTSLGISALNEIMEFLISLNMENGVGGYENTMLDIIFNLGGAVVATTIYILFTRKPRTPVIENKPVRKKKSSQ